MKQIMLAVVLTLLTLVVAQGREALAQQKNDASTEEVAICGIIPYKNETLTRRQRIYFKGPSCKGTVTLKIEFQGQKQNIPYEASAAIYVNAPLSLDSQQADIDKSRDQCGQEDSKFQHFNLTCTLQFQMLENMEHQFFVDYFTDNVSSENLKLKVTSNFEETKTDMPCGISPYFSDKPPVHARLYFKGSDCNGVISITYTFQGEKQKIPYDAKADIYISGPHKLNYDGIKSEGVDICHAGDEKFDNFSLTCTVQVQLLKSMEQQYLLRRESTNVAKTGLRSTVSARFAPSP